MAGTGSGPRPPPAPANVQAGHIELPVGSSLSGHLSQGQNINYTVRTRSAGLLVVETHSNIDTYLHAHDANNREIATNDDGGEGLNARIELVVNANETYHFRLRGYNNSVQGQFSISANMTTMNNIELPIGVTLSGFISSGNSFFYIVRTAFSGNLVVETTGSTDTYMHIYNSNMAEIATDDDSGQGLNARIELWVNPNDIFYIRVRGYGTSTSGSFNISAQRR